MPCRPPRLIDTHVVILLLCTSAAYNPGDFRHRQQTDSRRRAPFTVRSFWLTRLSAKPTQYAAVSECLHRSAECHHCPGTCRFATSHHRQVRRPVQTRSDEKMRRSDDLDGFLHADRCRTRNSRLGVLLCRFLGFVVIRYLGDIQLDNVRRVLVRSTGVYNIVMRQLY